MLYYAIIYTTQKTDKKTSKMGGICCELPKWVVAIFPELNDSYKVFMGTKRYIFDFVNIP